MIKNSLKFIFLITLLFVLINVIYIKPELKALPINSEISAPQALTLTKTGAAAKASENVTAIEAEEVMVPEPTPEKLDPEAVVPSLVEKTVSTKAVNTSSEPMATAPAAAASESGGLTLGAFRATAYCLRGRTANGGGVRRGVVAADPRVLPLGSKIQLNAGGYSGTYTVADTGGAIRGKILDIWVPNCGEAVRFGRRTVHVTVHSRGGKARKAKK